MGYIKDKGVADFACTFVCIYMYMHVCLSIAPVSLCLSWLSARAG